MRCLVSEPEQAVKTQDWDNSCKAMLQHQNVSSEHPALLEAHLLSRAGLSNLSVTLAQLPYGEAEAMALHKSHGIPHGFQEETVLSAWADAANKDVVEFSDSAKEMRT